MRPASPSRRGSQCRSSRRPPRFCIRRSAWRRRIYASTDRTAPSRQPPPGSPSDVTMLIQNSHFKNKSVVCLLKSIIFAGKCGMKRHLKRPLVSHLLNPRDHEQLGANRTDWRYNQPKATDIQGCPAIFHRKSAVFNHKSARIKDK